MSSGVEGKTRFGASLQLFALRTVCASIVWAVILAVNGPPSGSTSTSPLGMLVAGPIIIGGATMIWGALAWLGSKGVPFTGLFALPAMLFVIPGDPLLFLLHAATKSKWPDIVPVERVGFINLAAFIVAVESPDHGPG